MKTILAGVLVAAGLLLAARPTLAHHAFSAEFDANKPVSLTGTVMEQDLWGPGPHPRTIQVTVSDGALFAELSNRGKVQLSPQTQTRFAGFFGWSLTFLPNSQGVTTDVLEMHISGNYKYTKKK